MSTPDAPENPQAQTVSTAKGEIEVVWLSVPEVAEVLGVTPGKVRRLLDDDHLIGLKRDGVLRIPSVFLDEDRPLSSLRGTVIALHDVGLSTEETIDWLFSEDDSIGGTPIAALIEGRKSQVRRVARTLA